jgi:hypothetical protein
LTTIATFAWLWDAIDGARRSDGRGRWYARVSIVDHLTAVQIDNASGYFSITMPCRCENAFTTPKAKQPKA